MITRKLANRTPESHLCNLAIFSVSRYLVNTPFVIVAAHVSSLVPLSNSDSSATDAVLTVGPSTAQTLGRKYDDMAFSRRWKTRLDFTLLPPRSYFHCGKII